MLLALVVGCFFDAVAAAGCDFPYDAMFRTAWFSSAVVLLATRPGILPLGVQDVIAGLRSGKCQVRADFVEECSVNLKGHRICGLP